MCLLLEKQASPSKIYYIYRSMMSIDITATKKTLPFLLSRRRVASPLLRSRRHFTASPTSRGPRHPYSRAACHPPRSRPYVARAVFTRGSVSSRPTSARRPHARPSPSFRPNRCYVLAALYEALAVLSAYRCSPPLRGLTVFYATSRGQPLLRARRPVRGARRLLRLTVVRRLYAAS